MLELHMRRFIFASLLAIAACYSSAAAPISTVSIRADTLYESCIKQSVGPFISCAAQAMGTTTAVSSGMALASLDSHGGQVLAIASEGVSDGHNSAIASATAGFNEYIVANGFAGTLYGH